MVAFTWEPIELREESLQIQLIFDRPYDISTHGEPNEIEITLQDIDFFVLASDESKIEHKVTASK